MVGKEWSALLKLIQDVSAFFSISINSFLIILIVKKSPKQLGVYKYLMMVISVFEIAYSVLDIILVPMSPNIQEISQETPFQQHYSHGPTFLVIVGVKDKLFGPSGLTVLNACYWGFFGASMAMFAVHFIYRYLVFSGKRLLKSFNDWRFCLWMCVPLCYGLTWVCTGYFLCAPNESTTNFIRDNIKQSFELEYGEYIYLGPYLYEKVEGGGIVLHVVPFIGLGIISATIVSSIVIVLVFGILCYTRMSKLVSMTSSSTGKTQKLQKQLFVALVIQTLIPFLLMHIPAAIMFAFVFLDIDLGIYSAVVSMTTAVYPAADPIPTIIIVESYRNAILEWIGCRKKPKPEVAVTTGAFTMTTSHV